MLLVLTFLGGSALLGVCLIHRCFRDWLNAAEQVLWGIVVGWVVSAVVTYGVARWLGRLTASAVTWTTLVIWVCSVVLLLPSISHLSLKKIKALLSQKQFPYYLLLLCLFSPIYWQLFSSHFFARGADGIYSGGSAAADLNF